MNIALIGLSDSGVMKGIKVANVLEEGKVGGPQVRIVNVAQMLDDVETIVVAPSVEGSGFKQLCDRNNVPFIALNMSRITKEFSVALRFVLFSIFEIWKLKNIFIKQRVDVVHASGGSWQFKAVLAARLADKKVLWHLNDTSVPGFIRLIFKRCSRFADGFIFASERTRDYYSAFIPSGKKSYLIPAPVDTKVFDLNTVQPVDLGLPERTKVVGMVANINRLKGLDVFVKTAAQFKSWNDEVYFVVVGPVYENQKAYYAGIQKLADDLGVTNIRFVGGQQDVRAWVAAFDVYLCCSRAESSPISVWEAMALAKPVVATDVGDISKYVVQGKGGFVVPNEDAKALAEGLKTLLDDHFLLNAMSQYNRHVACEQLDLSFCVQRHRDAYQDILLDVAVVAPENLS